MRQPDVRDPVTILGAGIVGICTALSLLERGVPVTLVDRGAPGQETSFGNAGVVSPWSFIPQAMPGIWKNIPKLMLGPGRPLSVHPRSAFKMVPWGVRFLRQSRDSRVRAAADAMSTLCAPSIELFERHLHGTGHENLLVESIYLQAFRDHASDRLDAIDYQLRAEKGAEIEIVGREQLARLEPALSSDFRSAVLIKGAARVRSPGRVASVLFEKALLLGAKFVRAQVRRLRRSDQDWTVHCDGQDLRASRVVVCMGVWSPEVLGDLPFRIPLMSERGYHAEFGSPGIALNNSVMDTDAKFIASSMEGGLRVAGHAEFAPPDAPPNRRREKILLKLAKAAFPDLQTQDVSFWMGRRPSFPDSLPMIDAPKDHPGLFVNFGHSHFGLMMSPASGELVAQLVCGGRPNVPLDAYALDRF